MASSITGADLSAHPASEQFPFARVAAVTLALPLAGLVALLVAAAPLPTLGAAAGGLALLLLIQWPRWGLYGFTAGVFALNYAVSLGPIPRFVAWFPELVLAAMFVRVCLVLMTRRRSLVGGGLAIGMCVLTLVALGLLGALANGTSPVTMLLGLRGSFKFIALFYLLLNIDLPLRVLERTFRLIWLFVFVQPGLVFLQWFKEECRNCWVDSYYGTLMSTATLSIVAGLAAAVGVAVFLERRDRRYLLLTVPILFSLGLADSKGGFVLAAVGAVVPLAYRAARTRFRRPIRSVVVPAFLGSLALYYTIDFAGRNLDVDLLDILSSPRAQSEYAVHDPDAGLEINRAFDLALALQTVRSLPTGGWLGAGPGSASPSIFEAYTGEQQRRVAARVGREMFFVNGSRLLIEFGFLGLTAWACLYSALFQVARSSYRSLPGPIWRARALALTGFVAVIVAAQFYHTVLDVPTFVLWFTAALLIRARRSQHQFLARPLTVPAASR